MFVVCSRLRFYVLDIDMLRIFLFFKTVCSTCNIAKVTIRPDFTGTVLNFDGLSRENYEVSRHGELSRIPNPVPILFRFECNVISHVDKLYSYRPNTYSIGPIPNSLSSMRSFELKMHLIIFGWSSAPRPLPVPPWTPSMSRSPGTVL